MAIKIISILIVFFTIVSSSGAPSVKNTQNQEAQDIKALKSAISEVTVFFDRAQVTRTATERLEKGEHALLFDNLPESIEQNSIQAKGLGQAILKDVKFRRKHFTEIQDKEKKILCDKKQQLQDELSDADDRIAHANKEKAFMEDITKKLTGENKESKPAELDPEKWIKMVAFYRTKLDTLDKEIRNIEKSKRNIENELDKVDRELGEIEYREGKTRNQVELVIEVKQEGDITLNLSYIVYGPSWHPVYDLRVSTDKKTMAITYNAMLQQNTTENWADVQIKLSTAQPQINGQQPSLTPWHIDIVQPKPSTTKDKRYPEAPIRLRKSTASVASKQMIIAYEQEKAAERDDNEEIEEPLMQIQEAAVETKATSVVFVVNGNNTINSDNLPHKVTIAIHDFPAYFRYSTVPKLAPYAYLKAKVKNESTFPFLPGETNVFLDNNFVANAYMDPVAPLEEFWTFLGVDEGMKVVYKFIGKYEKNEGIISKKTKIIYEYLTVITNHKKTDEEIVVWDQLPISGNEHILVTLIEPKYDKNTDLLKMDSHKNMEWFFKPKAGEKIEIPFKFSVDYPKDSRIIGLH